MSDELALEVDLEREASDLRISTRTADSRERATLVGNLIVQLAADPNQTAIRLQLR